MGSLNSSTGSAGGHGAAAAAPARHTDSLPAKPTGYGLPCSNCKTYYAADLAACPVCKNRQRVSAMEPLASFSPAEQLPDPEQLEEEDRKSTRLNSSHSQISYAVF